MARRRSRRASRRNILRRLALVLTGVVRLGLRCLPLIISIAVAGGVFFGVREVLYADPSFSVQNVLVAPPDALTNGQYRLLEKKFLGKNILRIDLGTASGQLEDYVEVREARVIREFPSTVRVQVERRKPIAWIRSESQGHFGLVSEDGMILELFERRDDAFPFVEAYGLGIGRLKVGQQIQRKGFFSAVDFLKAYWKHPMSKKETVTHISIDRVGNVTITLGFAPKIRLGQRPETRIGALEQVLALLASQPRNEIEYIDLQFDNVVIRRKK